MHRRIRNVLRHHRRRLRSRSRLRRVPGGQRMRQPHVRRPGMRAALVHGSERRVHLLRSDRRRLRRHARLHHVPRGNDLRRRRHRRRVRRDGLPDGRDLRQRDGRAAVLRPHRQRLRRRARLPRRVRKRHGVRRRAPEHLPRHGRPRLRRASMPGRGGRVPDGDAHGRDGHRHGAERHAPHLQRAGLHPARALHDRRRFPPIPEGISCQTCNVQLAGNPIATALTDANGQVPHHRRAVRRQHPARHPGRKVAASGTRSRTSRSASTTRSPSTETTRLPRTQGRGQHPAHRHHDRRCRRARVSDSSHRRRRLRVHDGHAAPAACTSTPAATARAASAAGGTFPPATALWSNPTKLAGTT